MPYGGPSLSLTYIFVAFRAAWRSLPKGFIGQMDGELNREQRMSLRRGLRAGKAMAIPQATAWAIFIAVVVFLLSIPFAFTLWSRAQVHEALGWVPLTLAITAGCYGALYVIYITSRSNIRRMETLARAFVTSSPSRDLT